MTYRVKHIAQVQRVIEEHGAGGLTMREISQLASIPYPDVQSASVTLRESGSVATLRKGKGFAFFPSIREVA